MDKTRLQAVFTLIILLGILIGHQFGWPWPITILLIIVANGWFLGQVNPLQFHLFEIQESYSNLLVAMETRLDLANQLVEMTASHADHEKMLQLGLSKIETSPTKAELDAILDERLAKRLMKISRAYPDLRANPTYQELMSQLQDNEHDLQDKRETYNQTVRVYNASQKKIPIVFLAKPLGFHLAPYFDTLTADAMERVQSYVTADDNRLKKFLSEVHDKPVTEISSRSTQSSKD